MTDPRNIAHDKRLQKEKKHHGIDQKSGTHGAPQPGRKQRIDHVANHEGSDSDELIDKTDSDTAH